MFAPTLISCASMLLPNHLAELAKLVHLIPASCNLKKAEIQDVLDGHIQSCFPSDPDEVAAQVIEMVEMEMKM